jgi:hypothetical protein
MYVAFSLTLVTVLANVSTGRITGDTTITTNNNIANRNDSDRFLSEVQQEQHQRRTTTVRNPKKKKNTDDDDKILLESFANPKHEWVEMNDPVMGGKSTGSFRIDDEKQMGIFVGTVNNVPFLHAPGFIQVRTIISSSSSLLYPDISHCQAFELIVASQYPQYPGYRMSFGTQHAPHGKMFAYGYKTHFTFESNMTTFQSIILPFHKFTDYWDDATGDAIIECNPDDSNDRIYCPTIPALQNIQTIGLWGEGFVGDVNINIQAIYATQCHHHNNSDVVVDDYNDDDSLRGVNDGTAMAYVETWWSRLNLLLFGNNNKADTNAFSSSSSSTRESTVTTTSATTAILQRNMILSSLYHHRW